MSDTKERVTFFYDCENDSDIHDWIKSLPERGKTSHIQKAIRFFLAHSETEKEMDVESKEIKEIFKEMNRMKDRILTLEETLIATDYNSPENEFLNNPVTASTNEQKGKFIDGKEILKNLGE